MINYKNYPNIPATIEADILQKVQDCKILFDSTNQVAATSKTIEAFNSQRPVFTDRILGVPFEDASKYYPDTAKFSFIDPPDSLVLWVHEHIGLYSVNIQIMEHGNYVMPHIDEIRKVALNYLITTGSGITCIYEPIAEYANYIVGPQMVFPPNRIVKTDKISIDEKRWHTLDVSKIHGVENLTSKRISVSVSLLSYNLL